MFSSTCSGEMNRKTNESACRGGEPSTSRPPGSPGSRCDARGVNGQVLRWMMTFGFALAMGADPARAADPFEAQRHRMVDELVTDEGLTNARVIEVLRRVPRHAFVSGRSRALAYFDMALPIGQGQTISPPSLVAYMTEQLDPQPADRVLEVGTGSGYQAAVLSLLVRDVFTIEIVPAIARRARSALARLGFANVHARVGDGYQGWAEHAPFDKIIVSCSPSEVPPPLIEQLRDGGRLIVPLGETYQQTLWVFAKKDGQLVREAKVPTVFVPMTGMAQAARAAAANPFEPRLVNASFEAVDPETGRASGWYHQRQMAVETATDAPDGTRYATFRNTTAGRRAQAAQAFPVDGRHTRALLVSGMVRGARIEPGPGKYAVASLVVAFYSAERETLGQVAVGGWRGDLGWTPVRSRIEVPATAREAILGLGLYGATGTLSFDRLAVEPAR